MEAKPMSKAQVAASALKVRRGQALLADLPKNESGPVKAMLRRGDKEMRRHLQLAPPSSNPARVGRFVGQHSKLRKAVGG